MQENLVSLILLRPLRLVVPSDELRRIRIVFLKVTHFPFVGAIWAYESGRRYFTRGDEPLRSFTDGRFGLSHLKRRPFLANDNSVKSLNFQAAPTTSPTPALARERKQHAQQAQQQQPQLRQQLLQQCASASDQHARPENTLASLEALQVGLAEITETASLLKERLERLKLQIDLSTAPSPA
ncbi:MAG: hypothetical protein M1829_003137 [Trizodia sp. TS-e1964]|nr:MAG: hypothetical protein M1829_003137 [Trizodia sp. TS-e1964]